MVLLKMQNHFCCQNMTFGLYMFSVWFYFHSHLLCFLRFFYITSSRVSLVLVHKTVFVFQTSYCWLGGWIGELFSVTLSEILRLFEDLCEFLGDCSRFNSPLLHWGTQVCTMHSITRRCFLAVNAIVLRSQDFVIYFLLYFIFNWRMIALPCCVGLCLTLTWASHKCTYIPSLLNLPSPHPRVTPPGHQWTGMSSLCGTAASHQASRHTVMHLF